MFHFLKSDMKTHSAMGEDEREAIMMSWGRCKKHQFTNLLAILAKGSRKIKIKNKSGIRKNCIVKIEKVEYLQKDDERKSDDDFFCFSTQRVKQ